MISSRARSIDRRGAWGPGGRAWLSPAFLGLLVVIGLATTAAGQGEARGPSRFYPDSSDTAESLLRNAAGQVANRQWAEAIEIYQRVIERFGDKLAKIPRAESGGDAAGEFVLYVDNRTFCHRAIGGLPAEARALYRARTDSEAELWFRKGQAGDAAALERVIDQAFCSSWGDDALELLGDLAFQDGRVVEALALYRRLVPDGPADPLVLVYPDPSVDLARIAAKKLLCRAVAGEATPTAADLVSYAKSYPDAAGALAGRKGLYREILKRALEADHLSSSADLDGRWPTFAGSLRRTKIAPGPVDVGSIQWRIELEKVAVSRGGPSPFAGRGFGNPGTPLSPERLLAFHPIVLGDQVLVADGSRVVAYNLSDRPAEADSAIAAAVEPAWKHDPDDAQNPRAARFQAGAPRYTLTAFGRRVYARMGGLSPPYFPGMGGPQGHGETSIIALDWNAQGKLLWERKASTLTLPNRQADRAIVRTISFEGTPVADPYCVYVAVVDRREQTATYVACLDAETGASRWIRYVGTASTDGDMMAGAGFPMPMSIGSGDSGHRLLAIEGSTLYYQTNLGAVAAIDAQTGSIRWAASYPRSESGHGSGGDRDLNPAVVDGGRVFVAPADSDAIYAFSAQSGRLLWKSDPIADDVKLTHVLGVARGRLVATGDRVLLFDVATGKLAHVWPDSGKSLEGYGRGLLAGDFIYWPTKDEIQILDQRTGLRAEPPIKLRETYHTSGGNLVAGDGYLIVAQDNGLVVFCQNSRLIERYRQQIALEPNRAANYFRMGRAAEALGRDRVALDAYRSAWNKSTEGESIDGVVLKAAARDHQFRLLLRLADLARKANRWNDATTDLEEAALAARTDADQLRARLKLADALLDSRRPRDAVAVCQRILADDRLRGLAVAADGRRSVRADLLIADRLSSIVEQNGREVYAAYDLEAQRLFDRAKAERDPRRLDAVARTYPAATVAPDALFELAALEEKAKRPADAAAAYKRVLSALGDDPRRALALWRLARVYEARGLHGAARECYLEIKALAGRSSAAVDQAGVSYGKLAAAALARSPYDRLAESRSTPSIPLPLERGPSGPLAHAVRLHIIVASGIAPRPESGRVFLVEPDGLRLVDPRTGSAGWTVETGGGPVWAGYQGDKLIAAAPNRVTAVDFGQSTERWRFVPAKAVKDADRPNPFVKDDAEPPRDVHAALSGFQLVKGRLFCLHGKNELIALDAETGVLDWSFTAPSGTINPKLWIGADRIVLEVDKPNQILILRTDDGRPTARASLGESERLERAPLPLDDNSVLIVPDRLSVKRLDLDGGQFTWSYQESDQLPVNGPPLPLGDGERLFVVHDGRTLIRLDPVLGSKKWSAPLGFEDLSERPDALAFDDERFYCASRQTLRAIALSDGKGVWSRPLIGPLDASWSILGAERHLIVYPRSVSGADDANVENMPVAIRDRKTGALVQRFTFATAISDVALAADARGLLVSSARGLWVLGPRPTLARAGGPP